MTLPRLPPSLQSLLIGSVVLAGAVALVLAGHVAHGGLYLDDWTFASQYGVFAHQGLRASIDVMSSGQPGASHVLIPHVMTGLWAVSLGHPSRAFAILALLWLAVGLLVAWIARRLGLGAGPAIAIAVLTLVAPWGDANRLWLSAGVPCTLALVLVLGGIATALHGLSARSMRATIGWHAGAAALFVLGCLVYESVGSLVLMAGFTYVLAGERGTAAGGTWGADIATAGDRAGDRARTRPPARSIRRGDRAGCLATLGIFAASLPP